MEILRNYTFLSWLRQGLAAEISATDSLGSVGAESAPERVQVRVSFDVGGRPVSKDVQLLGPGDIVGINRRAVVKVEPRHGVMDFEANYLPYIEFYEEEFPWRFTPARASGNLAQSKLRPWISLIVLAEDEFDDKETGAPLPAFEIKEGFNPDQLFPDKEQSWAWAHVHVGRNIIGDELPTSSNAAARRVEQELATLLKDNPDNASSRLLCPRKLKENTAYHAFLIPTFETGRLAGLGAEILEDLDGQKASWGDGQRIHPIYYRWFFRTGTRGDFEFLVNLLEPRVVDERVGVRDMDMQKPGFEVPALSPPFDVIGLEGALRSLSMKSAPPQWPPAGTQFVDPPVGSVGLFLNQLETKVNLQSDLQEKETTEHVHPDPIISPPLYGRWHAQAERLDVQNASGWVDELNRDPRLRAAAGVGTTVIQKDQETLMQEAWSQLGDLLRANQKIRQLQLGLMSSFVMYRKSVVSQSSDQLLGFTTPVHPRVLGSPTTIAHQVKESRLPQAALDPAFRKITRANGVIMRKASSGRPTQRRNVLTQLNKGELTAAPLAPPLSELISMETLEEAIVENPTRLPEGLYRALRENKVRWWLLGLVALALVLMFLTGAFIIFAVIIAVTGALFMFVEKLRVQLESSVTRGEPPFTPKTVDNLPARPRFALTEFGHRMGHVTPSGNTDNPVAANFRLALKDAFNVHQTLPPLPPKRKPLNMDSTVRTLVKALNPSVTIPRRAEFMLKIPTAIKDSYLHRPKTLVSVMAHPIYTQPMYRSLRDISTELLIPNLDLIPNNTVSLMGTNPRFIEAYMVGLNHEMAMELLWREFPTDQRGSYFRQFWDVADVVHRNESKTPSQIEEELLDIAKLHKWGRDTALGTHENRPLPTGGDAADSRLVVVVRGDLLKKYPTVVIYAQRAKWGKDEHNRDIRVLDDQNTPNPAILDPIFKAEIEPDIRFLGFNLTETEAKGSANFQDANPGWFFVIQERPGEPRFGLDNMSLETPSQPQNWNQLAWEHLPGFDTLSFIDTEAVINTNFAAGLLDGNFHWGRNAADMAYILYQVPVMVAFHAADMLD